MDRICPFLALGDDGRSVVDGVDPTHRCLAALPSIPLDRSTQAGLCLHEGHAECARFKEANARRLDQRASPRPAPDATFASTRLILEPDSTWGAVGLGNGGMRRRGRVVFTGASVLLLLGAAAAGASTNGFGLLATSSIATPSATPSAPPTASPVPTATASPVPTATVGPTPTPAPPTGSPTRTARPSPRTYVVQAGDTLSSIAVRFGVTVQQLSAANNLDPKQVINIGQVLVIP